MQAVILVGGRGTRLRPLTEKVPKPLVPVQGRPFLSYLLDRLKEQGFNDILLCVGYLKGQFKELLGDGNALGLRITYAAEEELLGTAGALKHAEDLLDDDFLLLNGDTLFDIDYAALVSFHGKKRALLTFAVRKLEQEADEGQEEQQRRGVIALDGAGRVLSFEEKPLGRPAGSSYINGGAIVVSKKVLAHIPAGKPVSLEKDIVPQLINTQRLYGLLFEGYFIDIGTQESLTRLEQDLAGQGRSRASRGRP